MKIAAFASFAFAAFMLLLVYQFVSEQVQYVVEGSGPILRLIGDRGALVGIAAAAIAFGVYALTKKPANS